MAAQVKCADLSEKGETMSSLRTQMMGLEDAGKLVVDGEVNRQMYIY